MPVKFELTGASEMAKRLNDIMRKAPDEYGKALYAEAQIEMTESKRRVPVKTGALRSSGTVHEPEQHGDTVTVTLSYGDNTVDYAVYVHEDLEAFHENGEAKFLESVLKESAPYMNQRLAERLNFDKWAK